MRLAVVEHRLHDAVLVEAHQRAFAGALRLQGLRAGRRVGGGLLRQGRHLGVLVGDGVERAVLAGDDRADLVSVEVVEHGGAAGAGDLVKEPFPARAREDGAGVVDGDRHQVRLFAVEVDLRFARLIEAEELPFRARGGVERLGLGVEGQAPHVLGAGERGEGRGGDALRVGGDLVELAFGERAEDDLAVPGHHHRAHRHLPGGRRELAAAAVDAVDLAVVRRAEQRRAVGELHRAPHRGRVGDGHRAEVQPGADMAARVDADAGEVPALEVRERVELKGPRPDGPDGSSGERHSEDYRTEGDTSRLVHRSSRGSRGRERRGSEGAEARGDERAVCGRISGGRCASSRAPCRARRGRP